MLQAIGLSCVASSMAASGPLVPIPVFFLVSLLGIIGWSLPGLLLGHRRWQHVVDDVVVAVEVPDHCIQRPVSCWKGLDAIPCHLLHSHECLTVSPQQLS